MSYQAMIIQDVGCKPQDAGMIENIMCNHIFHSTLDWQTRGQFRKGAREAAELLEENRELFEQEQVQIRAIVEEMQQGK